MPHDKIDLLLAGDRDKIVFEQIRQELIELEDCHDLTISLQVLSWEHLWSQLVRVGVHKQASPLSEIGSTWQASLASMNVLHRFSSQEVASFGNADAFVPPLWDSSPYSSKTEAWSIPWLVDTRAIFFWRDILEEHHIDPDSAFQTSQQIENTLTRLQEAGIAYPWGFTTAQTYENLQMMLSWIWEAGGNLRLNTGGNIDLLDKDIRSGIIAYFRLGKFIDPKLHPIPIIEVNKLFGQRRFVAMMGGSWALRYVDPSLHDRIGIASPPGSAFVGTDNFVIWEHTPPDKKQIMLEIIARMLSPQVQKTVPGLIGLLPVRQDVLDDIQYPSKAHAQQLLEIVRNGRPFPSSSLGGRIENIINVAFAQLWDEVFKANRDFSELIESSLQNINREINSLLS